MPRDNLPGGLPANDPQSATGAAPEHHNELLRQEKASVRDLSRVIGRMTEAIQAVLPAPLCYRNLQQLKNLTFRTTWCFESRIHLDSSAKQKLQWWIGYMQNEYYQCHMQQISRSTIILSELSLYNITQILRKSFVFSPSLPQLIIQSFLKFSKLINDCFLFLKVMSI